MPLFVINPHATIAASDTLIDDARFIHAPHSRARLNTTRKMLTQSLTYLQVIPEYLNLLFPLGERELAQDFYSDGFYQYTNLSNATPSLQLPERAWSGRDFKICYSLKSVEPSESQTGWPWSIRHCAVHHTFDVSNVRSTWVIVKGNQLIEKRISSATSGRGPPEYSSYGTLDRALAAAFATHLIMTDWSAENWRWYINFLEEKFGELTQGAISIDADVPTHPVAMEDQFASVPRTNTQTTVQSPIARVLSPKLFRASTQKTDISLALTELPDSPPQRIHVNARSGKKQPLPPGKSIVATQPSDKPAFQYDTYGQRQFKFRHLQDVQDLEESANETILVLRLNLNIYKQISAFYRSLFEQGELPRDTMEQKCKGDLLRFERRVQGIESQTDAQIIRVEALLRLMADRKTLVRSLIWLP